MSGTKNIEKALKSIRTQTYPKIEIIVVDNFSTDSTRKVCENFDARFFSLRAGRSQARNYGIQKMNGEYVLFMDSDFVLSSTLVEDCVNKALSVSANCIIMPVVFVSLTKNCIDCSKMRNVEIKSGLGFRSLMLFFSAQLIRHIEFPSNVDLGEDMIFSDRVLECHPKIASVNTRFYHLEDGSIESLIRRSWNYGKRFHSTISEIGSLQSTQLILDLSAFNIRKMMEKRNDLTGELNLAATFFQFSIYILLKHFSFGISYIISSINP